MQIKLTAEFNRTFKGILLAVLITMLVACGADEGDDLDKFMSTAANDMGKAVEPLPEVLPYSPLQ